MKGKILIVDDELELLSAINDYLTSRGYDCECASETAEAMALLAHIPFDVVVTDIYLSPVVQPDGLSVISFIRERALASRVIVITAHDTPQITGEAQRLSADLILRKPVPLAVLDDALTALIGANR